MFFINIKWVRGWKETRWLKGSYNAWWLPVSHTTCIGKKPPRSNALPSHKSDTEITNDFKWSWYQKSLQHCVCHGKNMKRCRPFHPLTRIILYLLIKNQLKTLKMTLKWPIMIFKWPWDQKPLHHRVCQGKNTKSCRPLYL